MFEGLLQPMHLMVILAIAVFIFGPKKLPELGKSLGEAIRGFKSTLHEAESPAVRVEPSAPAAAPVDGKPDSPRG